MRGILFMCESGKHLQQQQQPPSNVCRTMNYLNCKQMGWAPQTRSRSPRQVEFARDYLGYSRIRLMTTVTSDRAILGTTVNCVVVAASARPPRLCFCLFHDLERLMVSFVGALISRLIEPNSLAPLFSPQRRLSPSIFFPICSLSTNSDSTNA